MAQSLCIMIEIYTVYLFCGLYHLLTVSDDGMLIFFIFDHSYFPLLHNICFLISKQ